jgi:hypothetical protein
MSTRTVSSDREQDVEIAGAQPVRLPVVRPLVLAYALSLAIAFLMAAASIAGLAFQADIYLTDEVILTYVPFDAFNLVAGLPILLGSIWLVRRGKLVGLLCWPAALLYVLYSSVGHLVGVPFGVLFLPYLLLVSLAAYAAIGLVANIDGEAVRRRLSGNVPAVLAGVVLASLTGLFIVINTVSILTALASQTADAAEHIPVWIADFVVLTPAYLTGGILLWQRKPLGYVGGAGLLLLYILLFAGLIPVLVFPAFYNGSPVDAGGVVFVLVAAAICSIPFWLYVRGIARS